MTTGSGDSGGGGTGPPVIARIWDVLVDAVFAFRATFWSLRHRWSR